MSSVTSGHSQVCIQSSVDPLLQRELSSENKTGGRRETLPFLWLLIRQTADLLSPATEVHPSG